MIIHDEFGTNKDGLFFELYTENGDGGSVTLIAVIMNVMSSFCKRSLIMEGAVASKYQSKNC